jgi:hypothetical protein
MTLTYTVTNEVNVPALTRMRIQIANGDEQTHAIIMLRLVKLDLM